MIKLKKQVSNGFDLCEDQSIIISLIVSAAFLSSAKVSFVDLYRDKMDNTLEGKGRKVPEKFYPPEIDEIDWRCS